MVVSSCRAPFVRESSSVGRVHLAPAPGAGTWSWASTGRQEGGELLGLSLGRSGSLSPQNEATTDELAFDVSGFGQAATLGAGGDGEGKDGRLCLSVRTPNAGPSVCPCPCVFLSGEGCT